MSPPPTCLLAVTPALQTPREILRFYVRRSWQGRGLAALLMEAARRAAASAGADAVWLSVWSQNQRAQAFYRKCGFSRVGDTTFTLGLDVQQDFVMLRRA